MHCTYCRVLLKTQTICSRPVLRACRPQHCRAPPVRAMPFLEGVKGDGALWITCLVMGVGAYGAGNDAVMQPHAPHHQCCMVCMHAFGSRFLLRTHTGALALFCRGQAAAKVPPAVAAGLMLGAGLCVVLPEGFFSLVEAQVRGAWHGEDMRYMHCHPVAVVWQGSYLIVPSPLTTQCTKLRHVCKRVAIAHDSVRPCRMHPTHKSSSHEAVNTSAQLDSLLAMAMLCDTSRRSP